MVTGIITGSVAAAVVLTVLLLAGIGTKLEFMLDLNRGTAVADILLLRFIHVKKIRMFLWHGKLYFNLKGAYRTAFEKKSVKVKLKPPSLTLCDCVVNIRYGGENAGGVAVATLLIDKSIDVARAVLGEKLRLNGLTRNVAPNFSENCLKINASAVLKWSGISLTAYAIKKKILTNRRIKNGKRYDRRSNEQHA